MCAGRSAASKLTGPIGAALLIHPRELQVRDVVQVLAELPSACAHAIGAAEVVELVDEIEPT